MAGVGYYSLVEIPTIETYQKAIFIGTVLQVIKEPNFVNFIVSDGTASAQATFYCDQFTYENQIQLPILGDIMTILGTCSYKQIFNEEQNSQLLKIKIYKFNILDSFEQEAQILQKTLQGRKKRIEKKKSEEIVVMKKVPKLTQKSLTNKDLIQVRTLILSYLYIVFSSNTDINTHLFVTKMVTSHKLSKQYCKDTKMTQKSFQSTVNNGLKYLMDHNIIEIKQNNQNDKNKKEQYLVKRRYFENLINQIESYVFDNREKGVELLEVTRMLNEKSGKISENQYIFNHLFVQKVLLDLIQQRKIYKTSDKKLYPANL